MKWKGYSLDESTWEPVKHLKNVMDLVDEFEEKRKAKTGAKEDQPKGETKEEKTKKEKKLKTEEEETPEMLKEKRPREEKILDGKPKKPRGRPKKNTSKEAEKC